MWNQGTMSANPVDQVDDQGPNGYDITQSTAAQKPSYAANLIAGKGGVQFDGQDWLDSDTFSPTFPNSDDFTAFVVVKFDSATSGNNEFVFDATQSTDRMFALKDTSDNLVYWMGGTFGTRSAPAGAFISTVVFNQAGWGSRCWQNGTLREVGNGGLDHDFVDIRVGGHNGGTAIGLDGDIYFLAVFEGQLSTELINVLGRYLARFFGLSWTDTLGTGAQSFDGTDDYLENTSFTHITDYPVSIGAWCRRDGSGTRSFFSLTDPSTSVDYIVAQIQNATRVIWAQRRATGDSNQNSVGTVNFLTNPDWHLVVIVCASATSCILYVDGIDAVENTSSVGFMGFTKLSVGRFGGSSPGQYVNGSVDSLFVSDEALTATDVGNIFNGGATLSDGTTGLSFEELETQFSTTYDKLTNAYKLDESSGDVVDLIGGKDLTRSGPVFVDGYIADVP
jgi:hypothetical protein